MAYTNRLEEMFDDIFVKNAPWKLSKKWRDLIVWLLPWLLVLGAFSDLYTAWQDRYGFLPHLCLVATVGVLNLIAFPGLLKRHKNAWDLVFFASLIYLVDSLIQNIRSGYFLFSLFGYLLGQAIGFYILFQVRKEYTEPHHSPESHSHK